jgi:peptide/nickel transport system permease protein
MSGRQSRLKELLQDKLALLGVVTILAACFIAIAGAYLRPDSTKDANEQYLALARKSPGYSALFFTTPDTGKETSFAQGLFFGGLNSGNEYHLMDSLSVSNETIDLFWDGRRTQQFQTSDLLANVSMYDSLELSRYIEENQVVKRYYLLGTDSFGRDMLSRLMAGTIVSLSVGFISVLISLIIGIGLGAIAGYFGGRVDDLIMWLINVIWSIPTLLMVIAITLVMGKGFVQVFVAVGLTMWVEVARIVRGQFLSLRTLPYIEAGQSMGFSSLRLIWHHMLPNAMGPVIVISAANFASAILIEAGLSFLGIGTQIPTPSWGGMIKEHYAYITTDMAYLAVLPGICITLLVLSFMLIGNRLRDVLDVRS